MSKNNPSKAAQDNRANQLNPTHPTYHRSRGASEGEAVDQAAHSKPVLDNRAEQLNPTSEVHQASRGKGETKGR
jgi:hypothetical protein